MSLSALDSEFHKLGLHSDPVDSFKAWFDEAKNGGQIEPEAMCVSSFSSTQGPSSRMVLLRRQIGECFYFFTNYESRKSEELIAEKRVALLFHWRQPFHRQIRIEGTIHQSDDKISDEYFFSRPYQSQISAWASPQSHRVESREQLENLHKEFEERFKTEKIFRPPFWGGWEIRPHRFEFWQEREHRFHDRLIYDRTSSEVWQKSRLAP